MAGDTSLEKKAHIVETLLSIAHVPMERVHTIRLVADLQQSPELWLRSFNGGTAVFQRGHRRTGPALRSPDLVAWR